MPKIAGNFTVWMIFGLVKDVFLAIFRAFGQMLGGAIAAGVIGALGGGVTALIYGFPIIPWLIGGFVVCAILALVLMVFVASDL